MNTKEALAILDRLQLNQRLSHIQELVFCQSWEGKTYQTIADVAGYDYDYIKEIGSGLWQFLSESVGERVTKKNVQSVLRRYDQTSKQQSQARDDQKNVSQLSSSQIPQIPTSNSTHADWGEAPDVSIFHGRIDELALLEQWIVQDRCRLVAMLGMGGIGKTALSVTLAEEIQGEFKYIIWRSLRNGKQVMAKMASLINILSDGRESHLPESLDARISLLIKYLRKHRCLIVLDGVEVILRSHDYAGIYREGYEGYGELLKRIGESQHQSCLVLTSREQLKEFKLLEGARVRSHYLRAMDAVEGREVLQARGDFVGTETDWQSLIAYYGGNPLVLKIIASIVQEYFDRNISRLLGLLDCSRMVFDDIRSLLDQHFDRLSDAEKQIMFWLAVNETIPIAPEMMPEHSPTKSSQELLSVLNSLRRRSLIVKTSSGFSLQPMISEYLKEKAIAQARNHS